MLPLQLGGSLSCSQVSTAGHMLRRALQTTQRFINTQIRLFMHGGEAEISRSTQPATLWEAASSPFPQPRPGKHHSHWAASTRLLPGRLESTLLPREAIGRFTTSPSAPLSLEHCPWGSCQHSQCHTTLMALWDQPRTPNPAATAPCHRSNPAPRSDRRRLSPRQPHTASRPGPSSSHLVTLCFRQLNGRRQQSRRSHAQPLPGAAPTRDHRPAAPPGRARGISTVPTRSPRRSPRSPPTASRC